MQLEEETKLNSNISMIGSIDIRDIKLSVFATKEKNGELEEKYVNNKISWLKICDSRKGVKRFVRTINRDLLLEYYGNFNLSKKIT